MFKDWDTFYGKMTVEKIIDTNVPLLIRGFEKYVSLNWLVEIDCCKSI